MNDKTPTDSLNLVEVSVIIPTNRLDLWLDQAVESVLAESRIAVEVIVVMDGIPAPREGWVEHPRVVVVEREKSGGPSAAMQSGIEVAKGELIARLDSDDVSLANRLYEQKLFLDQNPGHVSVSAQIRRINEAGQVTGEIRLPSGNDIRRSLLLFNFVPHSTLMFRKKIALQVGGYNTELRQMEDYDFLLRIGTFGSMCQLDKTFVSYRVHSGQTSRGAGARGKHIAKVIKSRNQLAQHLHQPRLITLSKNVIWRSVQFTRVYGVTKPRHMQ